jgi:hypothetical protein
MPISKTEINLHTSGSLALSKIKIVKDWGDKPVRLDFAQRREWAISR